jgi:protein-S-isoprenylcysteine O-methyltransferase Ste14
VLVPKTRAAVGSFVFLIVAPGLVAGLGPWLLTRWATHAWFLAIRAFGVALAATGLVVLLHAFVRFVLEGIGTPAPIAPTEQLVVGGIYRHVRNPMYLAVAAVILGQALLLGQVVLFVYAGVFGLAVTAFVYGYEEPSLSKRFGAQYEVYRRAVPAWYPRVRPWRPDR